jgi:hypothetical protein
MHSDKTLVHSLAANLMLVALEVFAPLAGRGLKPL